MKIDVKLLIIVVIYLLIGGLTILFFDGTGDEGDSIYHYLYAKYAFETPRLFFDHWAKPFYVLIFSPFAQFGFTGVKLLNLLIVAATLVFTHKCFELEFKAKNHALLATLLLIFAPYYFVLTFSGLTEPLFSLMLIMTYYFYRNGNIVTAFIILSFLPFVRSEGLLFILFFMFYQFVFKKNWGNTFCLLTGTFVYSLAGYFVHNDLAWVFTKIPYATLNSVYGSGDFFHFFEQLLYVVGIPFYFLIWLGVLLFFVELFRKNIRFETFYLYVLGAGMFILAHSIFWYFGIFNSMGLKRVLLGILPLLAIIAAFGLLNLVNLINSKNLKKAVFAIVLITVFLFPFTRNKAALDFKSLQLSDAQLLGIEVKRFITENNIRFDKLHAAHPYLLKILEVNPFDDDSFAFISPRVNDYMTNKDLIIWENWFSVVEHQVHLEVFENNPDLEKIFDERIINRKGRAVRYAVFRKIE